MLRYGLLVLFILLSVQVYAQKQGQALIDSLLKVLPGEKDDTNKVNMLYDIAVGYMNIDPSQSIKYADLCMQLSQKLSWKRGVSAANNAYGLYHRSKGDYRKELEYYTAAYKIDEETGSKNDMARDLLGMGNSNGSLCNFPEALKYYFRAIELNEETGNKKALANTFVSTGNVYLVQSNYPRSLDYYFKALALNDEIGSKSGSAKTNFSIGNVYYALKDFPNALTYYSKAIGQYETLGNKYGIAIAAQGIGSVYNNKGDYAKALEYDLKALKTANGIGNKYIAIACVGNIGNLYNKLGKHPMALAYSRNALAMAEESGDKHQVAWGLSEIGNVYLSAAIEMSNPPVKDTFFITVPEGLYPPDNSIPKGKAEKLVLAIDYTKRGLDTASKYQIPDVMQTCFKNLSDAYELKGDYKNANEYADKYIKIKDSIFTNEHSDQVAKISMNYIYSKERAIDSVATADARKAASMKLERQRRYTWIGIGGALLLAALLSVMVRNNKLLSKEKLKSEKLLLNILPSEVAEELKTTGTTTAKHFNNVTVLFTDFVNFTQAGEKMTAQELIDELDTCFKAFDDITVKHGIEKIKTIGDAYLAVGGLPAADNQHAEHVVAAAKDIRDFMEDRFSGLGEKTFRVRIGIHSGSVVAGIVGVKKFAYDIWGDTVNTAARMEQHSEAGRINISQTTFDLVKDQFECTFRGEIEAKNKGGLRMYFVEGAK